MAELTDDFLVVDHLGDTARGGAVRIAPYVDWLTAEDVDPADLIEHGLAAGLPLEEPGSTDGVDLGDVEGAMVIDTDTGQILDDTSLTVVADSDGTPDFGEEADPDARRSAAIQYADANSDGEPRAPRAALDFTPDFS